MLGPEGFPYWASSQWEYGDDWAEIWHGDKHQYYVFLALDKPGTVSGEVIALQADLPRYDCSIAIRGNDIQEVAYKEPPAPSEDEPEPEPAPEVATRVAQLPLVEVNEEEHFTKPCRTVGEVDHLELCRGSSRVVQLLGRSKDGLLVFARHGRNVLLEALFGQSGSLERKVNWLIGVVECLQDLHSRGLVHRDVMLRNYLIASKKQQGSDKPNIVACDLECNIASLPCAAPEVLKHQTFSFASDVYALGYAAWQVVFTNNCRPFQRIDVQGPLREVFLKCREEDPDRRPTLEEVKEMLLKVKLD